MRRAAIVLCALVGAGCADQVVEVQVDQGGQVQLRPAVVRVMESDMARLDVVAFDRDGKPAFPPDLEWASLDPDVVAVGQDGSVRALEPGWGRVVVTGASGRFADTAFVEVDHAFEGIAINREGYQVCGWKADGTVYCWGVGYPVFADSDYPILIAGDHAFATVSLGATYTCGVADGGDVLCWGSSIWVADICGSDEICTEPTALPTGGGAAEHVVVGNIFGANAACASGPGGVRCWGYRDIADPRLAGGCGYRCPPTLVEPNVTGAVVIGDGHACGLDADGHAWCWGVNDAGQLGRAVDASECVAISYNGPLCVPGRVDSGLTFAALTAGDGFACGLTLDGDAYCWGAYPTGSPDGGPSLNRLGSDLRTIVAGADYVCATRIDGPARCWGRDPITLSSDAAHDVAEQFRFARLAPASFGFCGIEASGAAICQIGYRPLHRVQAGPTPERARR